MKRFESYARSAAVTGAGLAASARRRGRAGHCGIRLAAGRGRTAAARVPPGRASADDATPSGSESGS
eukprot:753861-Hanusia_phi.AAC.15